MKKQQKGSSSSLFGLQASQGGSAKKKAGPKSTSTSVNAFLQGQPSAEGGNTSALVTDPMQESGVASSKKDYSVQLVHQIWDKFSVGMDEAAKVELNKEEIRKDLENRERLKRKKKSSRKVVVPERDFKKDLLAEERDNQSDEEEGDLLHKEIPHKLEMTPVLNKREAEKLEMKSKSLWQKFEDFVWLENHEYFYICCIHEYCGLLRNKSSPNKLICIRVFLLGLICIHAFFDLFTDRRPIFKEFRYWGLALTVLVCFVNLLCALQYKACLTSFILELSLNKSRLGSRLMSVDSNLSLQQPGWEPPRHGADLKKVVKKDLSENPTEESSLPKTTSVKTSAKASLQTQQRILLQVDTYLDVDRRTSLQQEDDDEDPALYYSSRDDKSGNLQKHDAHHQEGEDHSHFALEPNPHSSPESLESRSGSVASSIGDGEQYSALILNSSLKKYSPFHLFKWATILYQMAFLFQFLVFPAFWFILVPYLLTIYREEGRDKMEEELQRITAQTSLSEVIIDNTVPFLILFVDFTYNCVPFIWRHFIFSFVTFAAYIGLVIFYHREDQDIYGFLDWDSKQQFYIPIALVFWIFLVEFILITLTRWKLKRNGKDMAVIQLRQIYAKLALRKQLVKQIKAERKRREQSAIYSPISERRRTSAMKKSFKSVKRSGAGRGMLQPVDSSPVLGQHEGSSPRMVEESQFVRENSLPRYSQN